MRSRETVTYSLVFLLILSIFSGIYGPEKVLELDEKNDVKIESISKSNNLIDIPSWKLNDKWNYNGYLDMVDFIVDSGVNTNLQTLTGTLESTVTDIYITTVDNSSSLVYKVESEGYQALAMWAALTENRDVAIDQVYGPVSESKRRKLKRHMRTEVFKKMKRDEAQKLLTDNMMDANYFIDLMKKGVDIALKKEDVNGIRGFVNDGMEIHGMKDKETVTVTDKLEATQTRKLIDNINAEEDKLVASSTTKMPIKEVKDGDD